MTPLADRLKDYFTMRPVPSALFQISAGYVAGAVYAQKEGRITQTVLIPLERGAVEPSFDRSNIRDAGLLAEVIKEAAGRLKVSDGDVSLLVPDLSSRVFVLSLDSLPPSRSELENLINWKTKKQMPLLAEDVRFTYEIIKTDKPLRVLVLLARSSVIKEYETFFAKLRLNVRIVTIPALQLMNLGKASRPADLLVGNIEEDHIALAVFTDAQLLLYRTKGLSPDRGGPLSAEGVNQLAVEVVNTLRFIEDHEKKKIAAARLRLGMWEGNDELYRKLEPLLPLPVERIVPEKVAHLDTRERELLAPLIGQVP